MHFPRSSADLNRAEMIGSTPTNGSTPPAIIASISQQQKVEALKRKFQEAIQNIAVHRKAIYNLILELKEHHHEYGFKTAAAAVETVCERTKSWANKFCADIEAELEVYGKIVEIPVREDKTLQRVDALPDPEIPAVQKPKISQVANSVAASPDKSDKEVLEPLKPEAPRDSTGHPVPQRLLPLVNRREELTQALYWAAKLRTLMDNLQSSNDVLFTALRASGNVQVFAESLRAVHYQLSECLPDVVCPECQGEHKAKRCFYCAGSGMISKTRWHRDWEKARDERKQAEVKRRAAK